MEIGDALIKSGVSESYVKDLREAKRLFSREHGSRFSEAEREKFAEASRIVAARLESGRSKALGPFAAAVKSEPGAFVAGSMTYAWTD